VDRDFLAILELVKLRWSGPPAPSERIIRLYLAVEGSRHPGEA